jgi:hypothetical protein
VCGLCWQLHTAATAAAVELLLLLPLAPLQVPSIEGFMQQYHMQCPMAYTRLVQVGLPATIEHRKR